MALSSVSYSCDACSVQPRGLSHPSLYALLIYYHLTALLERLKHCETQAG